MGSSSSVAPHRSVRTEGCLFLHLWDLDLGIPLLQQEVHHCASGHGNGEGMVQPHYSPMNVHIYVYIYIYIYIYMYLSIIYLSNYGVSRTTVVFDMFGLKDREFWQDTQIRSHKILIKSDYDQKL